MYSAVQTAVAIIMKNFTTSPVAIHRMYTSVAVADAGHLEGGFCCTNACKACMKFLEATPTFD